MATVTNRDIIEVLTQGGRLTAAQAQEAEASAASSGREIGQVLIEGKLVDEETLVRARGTVLGLAYVDLQNKEIPPQILNLIPRQVAENTKTVAFERVDSVVHVGIAEPGDLAATQAIDYLAQTSGFRTRYFVISGASYRHAMKRYDAFGKDVAKALEVAKEKFEPTKEVITTGEESIEEIIKGAPVSRIVSVILRYAVDAGASDIHIEPYGEETRVRYRVDGILRNLLTLPKYIHTSIVSRIKVLANLKLDETRIPQDGRITERVGGKLIDFRVSTLPLAENEKVVMRVLDTTRGVPTLEQLGFRKEYVAMIQQDIHKPHGMFLITGPTGSGKSTTLFTILSMRNEEGLNISTLEDPVEYFIKGVNQAQVRPEVGFTFSAGLRSLLRQDPNVIMVGEIRDGETGELAVHAALTGHLIFSTLHTNDALGVVPRLMDMGLEPFLLSATLNMAVAQRLARRICERCKTTVTVPADVEERVRKAALSAPEAWRKHLDLEAKPLTFYKGRGCVRCNNTGYVGRVACAEIMPFDTAMRDLVAKNFPVEEVRAAVTRQGLLTIQQDAMLKALEGFTTIEEVFRITAE
jgi:type IV pilus assembly protein PilB